MSKGRRHEVIQFGHFLEIKGEIAVLLMTNTQDASIIKTITITKNQNQKHASVTGR